MKVAREELDFLSSGVRCAAWLFRPADASGPVALVILGHGLGGTRELRLSAYAERFAAAGYAALVFEHRYFGASDGAPRQLLEIERQLEDWHAALAFARALPGIDRERIALWGTSFGGGYVMQVAADDGGVAAVVAQCPFTDGRASALARMRAGLLSAAVLAFAGVVDQLGATLGAPPLLAPLAGTRGIPAFLASPESLPGLTALLPPGSRLSRTTSAIVQRVTVLRGAVSPTLDFGNEEPPLVQARLFGGVRSARGGPWTINAVAARLVLRIGFFRPGTALSRVHCPVLICVCDRDSVAPPETTVEHARRAPRAELQRYSCGHFEIYVGAMFERAVRDQLRFLHEHLSRVPANARQMASA